MAKTRKPRKRRIIPLIIIALALIIGVVLLDSNLRLSLTRVEIKSSELPSSFDGYRIVQISDLHGIEFGDGNDTLVEKMLSLRPDIIVMTGDFISDAEDLPAVERLVTQLENTVPLFYITGNHDWACGEIESLIEIMENAGVVCLQNDYLALEKNGESIILAGVEDPNSWADLETPSEFVDRLRDDYPDSYVVLLGHRNYWVTRYPDLDVDLILCGHSHGGVVRLPFIGGLFDVDYTLFTNYEMGLYESESYTMFVSRGLGQSLPTLRFLCNPEIALITLTR